MPVTNNSVGIELISDIRPKNDADHGVLQDKFLVGGFRRVQTQTDRDDIPQLRREEGMFVYVVDDDELWKLVGGLLNANWELVLVADKVYKAGTVAPVSFSGTPKVASVVFATPMASVDYTVTFDVETDGTRTYAFSVENRTVNGFILNSCANNIAPIVQVHWQVLLKGDP